MSRYQEIILIKNGEIALKGNNKNTFEDLLVNSLRRRLKPLGEVSITKAQSTICVKPLSEDYPMEEAKDRVGKIFGIAAYSPAALCDKEFETICSVAADYLKDQLSSAVSFKVEAKRSDKRYFMTSPEISRELGGYLLSKFPHLKVDVHNPEVTVICEIRDYGACIHTSSIRGAGGMPVSSAGNAGLLISGGIDSPVAAYMMAKRGLALTAIHFFSPPYTSEMAKQKVLDLLEALTPYCGRIRLFVVPFTEIQEEIRDRVPEEYFTLIMRRFMMRMSCIIAKKHKCEALITGESLGQVASQTLSALAVTDEVSDLPVFRPLIGMDKEEIVRISRQIGTFEISIQPYEDCCTVFTPRHPRTKPKKEMMAPVEETLCVDEMIQKSLSELEEIWIG